MKEILESNGYIAFTAKDANEAFDMLEKEHVDLQHLYIDGSKFEANANKYSWVWKKATEKSRYRLYDKITLLFQEINGELVYSGTKLNINTEYVPEYIREAADKYAEMWQLDEAEFVYGRGHRKSVQQRHYEKLIEYAEKLEEYIEKIQICGENRKSYSKTDHSATFMRIKTDYMGNDQLLPAYNVQIGVADEYIAVVDVNQYRSDMDCFVPLMKKFHDFYSRLGIERTSWLIGQKYARIGNQSTRNGHTLPLSARKFAGLMIHTVCQLYPLQGAHGSFSAFCSLHPGIGQGQFHILYGIELGQKVEILKDKADFAITHIRELIIVEMAHINSVELILTGRRCVQTSENVHKCTLTRSGRSHNADVFPPFYTEIHIAQGHHFIVAHHIALCYIVDFY